MTHIVVLGGGFGGTYLVKELERLFRGDRDVQITMVSRNNYMTFTPLLPEVAGNAIEERHAVPPLRGFMKKAKFHQGEVRKIDLQNQQIDVEHADGNVTSLHYDYLAVGLGAVTNYRNAPGATEFSFDLKSLNDAIRLRNHVLATLELADVTADPNERRALLTFVGIGGGYAGVEGLGQLIDFVHKALEFYPNIDPDELRFVLASRGKRMIESVDEKLSDYVIKKLSERGVDVRLGATCTAVTQRTATMEPGGDMPTCTVLWAAGIAPNPLILESDLPKNKYGWVIVDSTMQVQGHPNVFALGDCASVPKPDGFYPPTAQNATREGKVLAHNIAATIRGTPRKPFIYNSVGSLATIGHYQAVAQVFNIPFSGFPAWFAWRTIYLAKLPDITRKVRVGLDWMLNFFFPADVVQLPVTINDDYVPDGTPGDAKVETPRPLPSHTEAEEPATPLKQTV